MKFDLFYAITKEEQVCHNNVIKTKDVLTSNSDGPDFAIQIQHNVAMPHFITENVTTLSPGPLFSCSLARRENYGHDHRLTLMHVCTRHKL